MPDAQCLMCVCVCVFVLFSTSNSLVALTSFIHFEPLFDLLLQAVDAREASFGLHFTLTMSNEHVIITLT